MFLQMFETANWIDYLIVQNDWLRQANFSEFSDSSPDGLVSGFSVFRVWVNDGHVVPVEALQQLDDGVSLKSISNN